MTAAYVAKLVRSYPSIREIWLIGSRAAGSGTRASDWDYVAFADKATLRALIRDRVLHDPEVDLLVVHDGDEFCKPWRDGLRRKKGALSRWKWQRETETRATYEAVKPRRDDDFYQTVTTGIALRVFPWSPV
jgi:predicted nucleotidyltransferase